MNSVPNSDSEQCTESKLGWVHQVHTLTQLARTGRAHCTQAGHVTAVSWRAGCCIVSPAPAVSQAWLAVSRIVLPCRAPCREPSAQYRGASYAVSQPCCCRIIGRVATHPSGQALLLSQYNRLYRDTPR